MDLHPWEACSLSKGVWPCDRLVFPKMLPGAPWSPAPLRLQSAHIPLRAAWAGASQQPGAPAFVPGSSLLLVGPADVPRCAWKPNASPEGRWGRPCVGPGHPADLQAPCRWASKGSLSLRDTSMLKAPFLGLLEPPP